MKLPDTPGETIYFPTIQTCDNGQSNDWIEIPEEGEEEPESPAPAIAVNEAAGDGHGAEAEEEEPEADAAATTPLPRPTTRMTASTGSRWPAWWPVSPDWGSAVPPSSAPDGRPEEA